MKSYSQWQKYKNVQVIMADISTDKGRDLIANSIKFKLDFVLHNAAILDQPEKFAKLKLQDFRRNIATNVEPLLFLTQKLIPMCNPKARILSLSSGAAKQAIGGLGSYCVSKAAALMANQILKIELEKHSILVNDYFPGVVDTNMQKTLRSSTQEIFPYSDEFKKMKTNNQLNPPVDVAANIMDIFINSTDKKFTETQWIYKSHDVLDK